MSSKRKANEISKDGGWSVGASDNFSDWTIAVVDKESGKETSYHVHRKDLACGLHKSEYFSGVCRSQGLKESDSSATRLELESKLADAFPAMLNFLYTGKLSCKSKHIVPLFWLADYFMIESLQAPLRKRRQDKMNRHVNRLVDYLVILYQDATSLGHDETLDAIVRYLIGCRVNAVMVPQFLKVISPDFFLRLQPRTDPVSSNSNFVHKYVAFHEAEINDDFFCKLMSNLLPSNKPIRIYDIDNVVKLFESCPKVEDLPADVQKRVVESVIVALDREDSVGTRLTFVWKGVDLLEKVLISDKALLSQLYASMEQFFDHNPKVVVGLRQDKMTLLHKVLPADTFLKLFVTMQKQCKSLKQENANLKEEHAKEVVEYKKEFNRFRRFDESRIKETILSSHNHYSKAPKPELFPQNLPQWGDKTEKGWMYTGKTRPYPLYMYTG